MKFSIRYDTYVPWPVDSRGPGERISTRGTPPAGPWVATTSTVALTSGFSGVPLSATSWIRIVWAPEVTASQNGSASVRSRTDWASRNTLAWPSFDAPTCPTRPGCAKAKLDARKWTRTGVPFAITAPSVGDQNESGGIDAAPGAAERHKPCQAV